MKKIQVTDVILRDAHQSLIATRMRTEDMLPICPKLDQVGYWSLEVWGGATFDACVRFLKEDPWERLRQLILNYKCYYVAKIYWVTDIMPMMLSQPLLKSQLKTALMYSEYLMP